MKTNYLEKFNNTLKLVFDDQVGNLLMTVDMN